MNGNINRGFIQAKRISIGAVVRSNRKAKGYSVEQLAEASGVTCHAIEGIENGKFNAKVDILTVLGVYLDFEIELMK